MLFELVPGGFSDLINYIKQFEFKLKKKIIGIKKHTGKFGKYYMTSSLV